MSKVLPKIGGGSSRELWRCHPMDLFVVCWLGSEVLQEISNLFEKRSQIQEKGEHRGKEHPEERCVTGNWNLPCPDTGICGQHDSGDRPLIPHGCGDIAAPALSKEQSSQN